MNAFAQKVLLLVALTVVSGSMFYVVPQGDPVLRTRESEPALKSEFAKLTIDSVLMNRPMPFGVVFPMGYKSPHKKDVRYPVIYLLHGLTGNSNNWIERTRLLEYATEYSIIFITPEGGDGWYTDSVSNDKEKWESYILHELIPEVDKRFRTLPTRDKRAIAGLSMGGFGALKFGLKYPDKFVLVGSFSGALGAAQITEARVSGAIGKTIDGIFGPADSETRKSNDIFAIIHSMTPEKTKTIPFIYLDCGTEDFLFANNREFVSLLVEKKVPHEYRQLPGKHDWKYWDKQVQEFLQVADRFFAGTKP